MAGSRRNRHGGVDPVRIADGPLQNLHAAHRPANHRKQAVNAKMVHKPHLRIHHVLDGHHRETQTVRLPFGGFIGRPAGPHASPQNIAANHKKPIGIHRLAGTHHGFPPAGFPGDRILRCHMLIPGQGMTHQYGIRFVRVQCAVSLIGNLKRCQHRSGIHRQPFVRAKTNNQTARRTRFLQRSCQRFIDACGLRHGAG